MAEEVQRTFALARQKLGEVLSAVEFCDRSAIDFVFLGLKNLKNGAGLGSHLSVLVGFRLQYGYIYIYVHIYNTGIYIYTYRKPLQAAPEMNAGRFTT